MECASIKNIAAQARPSEMKDEAVSQSFDFDNFDRQYRDSICKRLNLSGDEVQSIRSCTNAQFSLCATTRRLAYPQQISDAGPTVLQRVILLRVSLGTLYDPAVSQYSGRVTLRLSCRSPT